MAVSNFNEDVDVYHSKKASACDSGDTSVAACQALLGFWRVRTCLVTQYLGTALLASAVGCKPNGY